MSLKGIELQIAIPKTFDAGKIAEQKHQQTQLNLDHANSLMERQVLKGKETVMQSEETAKTDADGHQQEQGQLQDGNPQQNEEEKKTVHPYKGAFVDFTG
jgi:hypothetical protein